MINKKIPELLAPAGSMDALRAAVSAGADAIYLGGKKFGARNLASNFSEQELNEAVEYCHARNVRVYVTHNTLVHDNEIADSLKELYFLYRSGVDAVLIQDSGILSVVGRLIPGLEIHASTQMTIHTPDGVLWAADKGISRVVLSREVGPEAITAIRDCPGTENTGLEVFMHGALCCSYSGQCLLSSMIGGRSGNRGLCAQPCRKEYDILLRESDDSGVLKTVAKEDSCYLMSPADLCTYQNLDKIVDLGVDSLKIEGRMKSAAYVANVVSIYRTALDRISAGNWRYDESDEIALMLAFNRGFTGGHICGESGADMMSFDNPANRGVYAGRVVGYDRGKRILSVKGDRRLSPEAGDGILIRQEGGKDFGLLIPGNAEIRGDVITFHSKFSAVKGAEVYITKRASLSKKADEITGVSGGVAEKISVSLNIRFDERQPIAYAEFMTLYGPSSVEVRAGFEMEDARSRPVGPEDLKNIFCKTGNLQYVVGNYESDYEGGLFAPMSLLNELRRDLFSGIEEAMVAACVPEAEEVDKAGDSVDSFIKSLRCKPGLGRPGDVELSIYVSDIAGLKAAADVGCTRVYYEPASVPDGDCADYASELLEAGSISKRSGIQFIWKWPRITDQSFIRMAQDVIDRLGSGGPDGIMVENAGDGVSAMRISPETPIYGGQGMNIFNHLSVGMFSGYSALTFSCELNLDETVKLCDCAGSPGSRPVLEYMVHGPAELLMSENNLLSSALGDRYSPDKNYGIADSTGRVFPIFADASGRTHVLNSAVTCLIDSLPEIINAGVEGLSLDLRRRAPEYISGVVSAYNEAVELSSGDSGGKVDVRGLRRLKKRIKDLSVCEITAGHLHRGV